MERGNKRLEIGKTVLGTQMIKDGNGNGILLTVYYGNTVSPPIDGMSKRLRLDVYYSFLNKFLNSEEGQQYAVPDQEQIEFDIVEQEKAEKEQEDRETAEALAQIEKEKEEKDKALQEEKEQKKQKEAKKKERLAAKPEQILFVESKEAKRLKVARVFLVILSVLLVASLAATAYLYQKLSVASYQHYAELNLNGTKYTIPYSTVDIKDGEGKMQLYGITTTLIDGEIVNQAIPLGEIVINGDSVSLDKKEETVKEEEGSTQEETQTEDKEDKEE